MNKPIRTPLTASQLEDAARLTEVYKKRVRESKARGDNPVLNQTEVGERCEWRSPQSTVSQYMRGAVALNLQALIRLAQVLDFDPASVSPTLAKGVTVESVSRPIPLPDEGSEETDELYDFIPQQTARAAAGLGHENPHVEVHSTLAFKKAWLKAKGLQAKNLHVIYANGESMWPTIQDHDVLLIDTSKIEPVDGGVFVVESVTDGTLVKRLVSNNLGGWILRSDNVDKVAYRDRSFLLAESNEHRIIGRVIWRGGDL